MNKLMILLLCLIALLMPISVQAYDFSELLDFLLYNDYYDQSEEDTKLMSIEEAVKSLHDAGLDVELDLVLSLSDDPNASCTVLDILIFLGLGEYDPATLQRTPISHTVYAFDAESFDIEGMYTNFLQGIQMIVPDVVISEIQEDLSGMTIEMDFSKEIPTDGTRSFSFLCNGNPYSFELDSHGDWFNAEAIGFIEEVLRKENCPKRLCILDVMEIQGSIIFYADEETIAKVLNLLGIQEGEMIF